MGFFKAFFYSIHLNNLIILFFRLKYPLTWYKKLFINSTNIPISKAPSTHLRNHSLAFILMFFLFVHLSAKHFSFFDLF